MSSGRIAVPLALLAAFVTLGAGPSPVSSLPVALVGDPAPGTDGGHFTFLDGADLSETGVVSFFGAIAGGSATSGVFVNEGGTTRPVALEGGTAPGPGGGIFTGFNSFSIRIDDDGDVAFLASLAGGSAQSGVFLEESGVVSPIVFVGDPAPGTTGTYASISRIRANDVGEIAFTSAIAGVTPTVGVFVESAAGGSLIVEAGDPAPGVPGATFESFGNPVLNDSGDVAFSADVSGPGVFLNGVWRYSEGVGTLIALEDERAAGTGGGTFDFFDFDAPGLDELGAVYFKASINGAEASGGDFEGDGADLIAIVVSGDTLPGTGGGLVDGLLGGPGATATGAVAYAATVSGGSNGQGVFVDLPEAGGVHAIAVQGETAAGTGGGTYGIFSADPVPSDAGTVAFAASVMGGAAGAGIFLPEPGSAASIAIGLIALAGLVRRRGRAR